MANPFDQFDDVPATTVGLTNPFDRFDPAPTPAPTTPSPGPQSSTGGAFVRGAEERAIPTAGGVQGAGFGAAAMAASGLPEAAAAIPVAGPFIAGGLEFAGAAGGFVGESSVVAGAQKWILDHAPEGVVKALGLDKEQRAADEAEHPYANLAGELAPNLLAFRPGAIAKAALGPDATAVQKLMANPVTARALPAAIMAGQEGINEYSRDGELDPGKIAIAAGVGAVSNKLTKVGDFLTGAGAGPVMGFQAALRNRGKGGVEPEAGMRDITPDRPGPAPAGTPRLEAPIDPQDIQPGDEESPIPTSIIAAGRKIVREATENATQPAENSGVSGENDAILARNGWPARGTRVTLDDNEGPATTGVVVDGFHTAHPETGQPGDGLQVHLDSGETFTAFRHEIDAAGIKVIPDQPTQAPLPLDTTQQGIIPARSETAAAVVSPAAAPVAPEPAPAPVTIRKADLLSPDGTMDMRAAGQLVSSRVKAALDQGATVTLHTEGKTIPIVGLSANGQMQDAKGLPWGAVSSLALPKKGNDDRLVITPKAATPVIDAQSAANTPPQSTHPTAAAPTGDGTQAAPIVVTHPDHVAAAEDQVNTAPTEAQKIAGNYAKGHIRLAGMDIAIENPKGSIRSGVDADGTPWQVTMPAAYGYVKRTEGADGDQVDVYIGPNPSSPKVFVIDQKDAKTGAFDEHKAMLGFDTRDQALAAYNAAFSDGKGPQRIAGVQEMHTLAFKKMLNSGVLDKPVAGGKVPTVPAPEAPVTVIKKTARAPLKPNTETSVIENIRRLGGIKTLDAQGRPTKEGQDIMAVLKDVKRPGLINNKNGQPVDRIRENMQQAGWFGSHPEAGDYMDDLYDLIRKEVHEGPQYHPESDIGRTKAETAVSEDSARVEQDARDEVAAATKGVRGVDSPEDQDAILALVRGGLDPESAVVEYVERRAIRDIDAAAEEDATNGYEEIPFEGGLAEAGGETRPRGQEPEIEPAHPVEGGPIRAPPESLQAPARQGDGEVQGRAEVTPSAAEKAQATLKRRQQTLRVLGDGWKVGPGQDGIKETYKTSVPFEGGRRQIGIHRENGKFYVGFYGPKSNQGAFDYADTIEGAKTLADKFAGKPALKGEPGAAGPDQTIVPGAESSARQLAQAREDKGHGRSVATKPQQDAGGMFAPKLEETGDMFSQPAKAAAPTAPEKTTAPAKPADGKIEDFGDVLTGARKHYAEAYRDRMAEAEEVDVAAEPLSKSWPEADYQKMLDGGADAWTVGFIHAARDAIPTKPQKSWKLKGWVDKVSVLRKFSGDLLNGTITKERLQEELNKSALLKQEMGGRIDLYLAVGHDVSLKGVSLSAGHYTVFKGVHYSPAKVIWAVEKDQKATAFSNMPRTIADGETREAAIEAFKSKVGALEVDSKGNDIRFDLYWHGQGENKRVYIGKKVGKGYIDLKAFDDVKSARLYLAEHKAELAALLERKKQIPSERRESNSPRVGIDHRSGADVTPHQFSDTFGFRGVQFGNYVEGGRRQADLNEAYDALMDMAGILDIPARAISLNGELGLAFGARGTGGLRPAKAHYEPDTIVINLTKANGAGSLAHEWWHALDNYFSRARGEKHGFVTEAALARGDGVRPEMIAAFQKVVTAIKQTALRQRSAVLDARRSSPYWTTGKEMTARSYESYIIAKLQDQSAANDYLANIVSEEYWKAAESLGLEGDGGVTESYPYPTAAEIPGIREAFDNFFNVIETREGEDGHQPLYSLIDRFRGKSETSSVAQPGNEQVGIGADLKRMIDLFGPKMYGADMPQVTAKELLQNSFDGIKAALQRGDIKPGEANIDIHFDRDARTLTITDNGAGMSPDIVKDAFLTVAGTNKGDLAEADRSGGFGIAKLAFIFGNDGLKLETVRDGLKTTLDTNSKELLDGKAELKSVKTRERPGTTVRVTFPEQYLNTKTGEREPLQLPYSGVAFDAFKKPLIGDVAVHVSGQKGMFGKSGKETLPIGRHLPLENKPKVTTAHFNWGDVDIYLGEMASRHGWADHHVLSSGLYQFDKAVPTKPMGYDKMPYDIIMDVRPSVGADSPMYPFNNQREDFSPKVKDDIAALNAYLQRWNSAKVAAQTSGQFADLHAMPITRKLNKASYSSEFKNLELAKHLPDRGNTFDLAPDITIRDGKTSIGGKNRDFGAEMAQAEKMGADKFSFPEGTVPTDAPLFHNNLNINVVAEAARRSDISPADARKFLAGIGTVVHDFRNALAKVDKYGQWATSPVGISLDKQYHGVHIAIPFKGFFLNPLSVRAKTEGGIARSFVHTLIHEAAHTHEKNHGESFTVELAKLEEAFEDANPGVKADLEAKVQDLLAREGAAFYAMREVYNDETTRNIGSDAESSQRQALEPRGAGGLSGRPLSGRGEGNGQGLRDGDAGSLQESAGRRDVGGSDVEPQYSRVSDDRSSPELDEAFSNMITAAARHLGWEGEPTSRAMFAKAQLMPKGPAKTELTRSAGLIKAMEDQRATPLRPAGVTPIKGTGETKTRGLAKGIADKAGVDGDLPEYDTMDRADQMARAERFTESNYEAAKAIAMGEEQAPFGVHPESVLIAVENRATREGDANLLLQLATQSRLVTEETTMGQRISMLAERDPLSPVNAIKEVQAARQAAAKSKNGDAPKAKKDAVKDMLAEIKKETGKSGKKLTWEVFISQITCKD